MDSELKLGTGKTDPVDEGDNKNLLDAQLDNVAQKVHALTVEDFKSVPAGMARIPHPFETYAMKKAVIVRGYDENGNPQLKEINMTYIVKLSNEVAVNQDPSNRPKTVLNKLTDKYEVRPVLTAHNRVFRNAYDQNVDVVFDKTFELVDGGKVERCALVDDHLVRSQLLFYIDEKTGAVKTDARYKLADLEQMRPLRRTFLQFFNPRLKKLHEAQYISEETQQVPAGMEN